MRLGRAQSRSITSFDSGLASARSPQALLLACSARADCPSDNRYETLLPFGGANFGDARFRVAERVTSQSLLSGILTAQRHRGAGVGILPGAVRLTLARLRSHPMAEGAD